MKFLILVTSLTSLCICNGLRAQAPSPAHEQTEAYAFMLYGQESHKPGLATAIYNLREFDKERPVVVITPNASPAMVRDLAKLNVTVLERPAVPGPTFCNDNVGEGKDRLLNSFFKAHIWNLTQFRTVLYLESDMLFRRPLDELFGRIRRVRGEQALVIAPRGHSTCEDGDFQPTWAWRKWNTGIMALRPSQRFSSYYLRAITRPGRRYSCYGGSQELENILFAELLQEKRQLQTPALVCMPIRWNCKDKFCVQDAAVVHWTGERKPWDGARGFDQFLPDWQSKRQLAAREAGIRMSEGAERDSSAPDVAAEDELLRSLGREWTQREQAVEALLSHDPA
mmetsp:Transcript_85376/g.265414  ORF Transcript_85376/g.265414 Transcript_85376/m.265414 type:complete len:339 (+) Transcript_85376:62-1078(+)|eukprot:CAMPEP_0204588388 /NCGR_PEP_ID=MMETSP0661-20131031/48594_1 /ASSEMBLY_ACC=CAM_ASM_000606 /TAXON_ID=109239 /ORGANISM="Alexandrium margalefi, Strain AMGDE01CS-322" /LENGTH=338 /DNA_ID=CAMNT_0051598199 /DNA_START=47 /DNA_END=1063 /DNA_ORIENTATION=+